MPPSRWLKTRSTWQPTGTPESLSRVHPTTSTNPEYSAMKFAELKTQLLSVGATINSITEDTTNWGGCCVVAAVVGKRLRELGVPVRAVVATYQGLSLL